MFVCKMGIRSFRPMVISPPVILSPPKVTSLHIQSHFALYRSYFVPHRLLSINIFISFRSVLSERDNLFVSTWSQMQMITELGRVVQSPIKLTQG